MPGKVKMKLPDEVKMVDNQVGESRLSSISEEDDGINRHQSLVTNQRSRQGQGVLMQTQEKNQLLSDQSDSFSPSIFRDRGNFRPLDGSQNLSFQEGNSVAGLLDQSGAKINKTNNKIQVSKIDPRILKQRKIKRIKTKIIDPRIKLNTSQAIGQIVKKKYNKTKTEKVIKDTKFRYKLQLHKKQERFKFLKNRGIHWTERSMIYQILLIFLIMFAVYFSCLSTFLYQTTGFYIDKIGKAVNQTITEEANKFCQDVINSMISQQITIFEVERQLTKQATVVMEPLLSDRTGTFEIDWEQTLKAEKSAYPDQLNTEIIQKDYGMNNALIDKDPDAQRQIDTWGYFESSQATHLIDEYFAKMKSLSHTDNKKDWWHMTLRHGYNIFRQEAQYLTDQSQSGIIHDRQLYLQIFQNNMSTVYQYPVTRKFEEIKRELSQDPSILQMVGQSYKESRETQGLQEYFNFKNQGFPQTSYLGNELISYQTFDTATDNYRVSKIAQPIKIGEEYEAFMIWEQDLKERYQQILVPNSFSKHKYPFVQVRIPQDPDFTVDENNQKFTTEHFPKSNIEFTNTRNQNEWTKFDNNNCQSSKYNPNKYDFEQQNEELEKFKNDKFDTGYPLGEIIYEQVEDIGSLKDINTCPEFIKFVNRIQDKSFSGDKSDKYPYHNFNMTYTDSEGKETFKLFKFFGQNMQFEKPPSVYQNYPAESRSTKKYNLLVLIIMDVSISQNIMKTSTMSFLHGKVNTYAWVIIILSLCSTLIMGLLIFVLINKLVLKPVRELTEKMTKQQDRRKMEKFVEKIQKMAERQKKGKLTFTSRLLKCSRKTVAIFMNQNYEHEDAYEVNEVEQLKILFAQFFLQYSKITRIKVNKTKWDLTDEEKERNERKRKNPNKFQHKLVMMMTENISKNQYLHRCQNQHVQKTRQYERFLQQENDVNGCIQKNINYQTNNPMKVQYYSKIEMDDDWEHTEDSDNERAIGNVDEVLQLHQSFSSNNIEKVDNHDLDNIQELNEPISPEIAIQRETPQLIQKARTLPSQQIFLDDIKFEPKSTNMNRS